MINTTRYIDLNCDMGESFGAYRIGHDQEILQYISSANIACGFHAGDPAVMKKTVSMAMENGVAIGAHPGFPDLQGFGRRNMTISPEEIYDLVVYQIGALWAFVKAEGGRIHHVKPHGALYNMAAGNQALAVAIAEAVYMVFPEAILYGLAGSELITVGKNIGLKVANEVFADRTYQPNGSLTPRTQPNALIKEDQQSIDQVLSMIKNSEVTAVDGSRVSITADTVCIHGDGEHALQFTQLIHQTMVQEEILIRPATGKND